MNKQLQGLIVLAVALVTATVVQNNALAQTNAARPPIIDVHMHAYAKDARWDHKVGNPITGQAMTATNEQSHMREAFAEMKKYNIVKSLVSADHEATLRWKTAAPDSHRPTEASRPQRTLIDL